jgi:ketosteroid isomerase-like protein
LLTPPIEERRAGPLEPFEKRALAGFVAAALIQALLGCDRARLSDGAYAGPLFAAAAILVCGGLWLLRARHLPGGAVAVPFGLLVATAGIYSGYSALNAPFSGWIARFSVPLLLLLLGAVLLFAEQEWQFQIVVFVLAAIAFVVVQVVLTVEARSEPSPVPLSGSVPGSDGGIIGEMQFVQVARSFVEAINAHDPAAIVALTTPDHRFVDSLGHTIPPADLRAAWEGYFRMVPDYRITVVRFVPDGDTVLAYGTAAGTFTTDGTLRPEHAWSTPAAWRATIRDGKVAEWQVYADNEPIRALMREGASK